MSVRGGRAWGVSEIHAVATELTRDWSSACRVAENPASAFASSPRLRGSVESAGGKGPLVDDEVRRAIEERARRNGKGEEREMGELEC